jgi:hypothetical protein
VAIEIVRWLRVRRQERLGQRLLAESRADEPSADPTA